MNQWIRCRSADQQHWIHRAADLVPGWHEDRLRLRSSRHADICVVNADGTGFGRLTTTRADSAPAWSPDGTGSRLPLSYR
jgi:hypothetical protein